MKLSRAIRPSVRAVGISALCLVMPGALAQTAPQVTLARLDCGNEPAPVQVASFSDTYAYAKDFRIRLTYSCYLIRHGDEYMVWDTGLEVGEASEKPRKSIVDLLRELKVPVDKVRYVGISHYHYDHTGQAASLPGATLLIGKGDWDVLTAAKPSPVEGGESSESRRALAPWISGGSKVEPLSSDKKDVFGDGTVVMLSLPGHTPGHHSLLVRLAEAGNVLLSGDATHFRENYENDGVPTWNFNRADTLASLDRFKQIAKNLQATVIIQHDPRDIDKLPAFPAAAK